MFKSFYCEKLEKTLHFLPDKIKFCCSCAEGPGVKVQNFDQIDKEEILKEKKRIRTLLKKGIIPSECNGCVEYKSKSFKENLKEVFKKENKIQKISHIIVDHYKQCDCKCIYCSQEYLYKGVSQNYDLLPVIKQLYASKMIDESELKAEFQGGGIAALKEFDDLMNEFYQHGCNDYVILMNGIRYMPILEKIGCNPKSHICISLDSGCRETFHKIKGVDLFDQTIENIKTLRSKSKAHIAFQYIIVKDVNDNLDELKKFLNIAIEIGGIEPISLEIDFRNTLFSQKQFILPEHYKEMFEYTKSFCEEKNIWYMITPYTASILKKGST